MQCGVDCTEAARAGKERVEERQRNGAESAISRGEGNTAARQGGEGKGRSRRVGETQQEVASRDAR